MKKHFTLTVLLLAICMSLFAADAARAPKASYYTVAEIWDVYNSLGLASGATSSEAYTVRGYVTQWVNGYPDYQNGDFYIGDLTDGSTPIECFRLYASNENDKRKLDMGEYVEATAYLKNYNGRAELVRANNAGSYTVIEKPAESYLTVAELMAEYNSLGLASGSVSENWYTVRGYVTKWNNGYPSYQNADFYIDDAANGSTTLLECFRLIGETADDKRELYPSEYVEAKGYLKNYNGRAELVVGSEAGTVKVLIAVEVPPSPAQYTLSISASEGGTVNTSVNGKYDENTQVTIVATANSGYHFVKWSDSNTSSTRTITMTKDITLKAEFAADVVEPDCTYPELNGKKGNDIRTALHAIIKDHKVLSYNNVWASATDADDRGDGTNNIWDMYTSCTFSKWDKCGSGESTEECECYNREHSLPKSWWGGDTSEPMYTDLHHVIPTDRFANEKRSAWPLGEVTNVIWTSSNGCKEGYGTFGSSGNNETFEPADEYKGDFARIYFYMATCYMDKNFTAGGKGYKVFSSGSANFVTTALNLYLKWHRNDPVSDKERKRNNAVEKKQGNRNPFVDEPDLVEYIWGNKKTVVYNCGNSAVEAVDADGQQSSVKKIIRDGQLLIIRGEEVYTVMGERVE